MLAVTSQYFAALPLSLYPKSDFWLNSPWLILIKLGVILAILPLAYLWTAFGNRGFSWVQQLGTASLLVYWVHLELVYGRWLAFVHESLNVPETILAAAVVILLMIGISAARTRGRSWLANLNPAWSPLLEPRRASGD